MLLDLGFLAEGAGEMVQSHLQRPNWGFNRPCEWKALILGFLLFAIKALWLYGRVAESGGTRRNCSGLWFAS